MNSLQDSKNSWASIILLMLVAGLWYYDFQKNDEPYETKEEMEARIKTLAYTYIDVNTSILLDFKDTISHEVRIENGVCIDCKEEEYSTEVLTGSNKISAYRLKDQNNDVNLKYTYVLSPLKQYLINDLKDTFPIINNWIFPSLGLKLDSSLVLIDTFEIKGSAFNRKICDGVENLIALDVHQVDQEQFEYLMSRVIFYKGHRTDSRRVSMKGRLLIEEFDFINSNGLKKEDKVFVFEEYPRSD